MRLHKFISTILHPIVMPTIGIILYFILSPISLNKQQKYTILSIVFVATYLIPMLLLVFLKSIGYIKSFRVHSINERKFPIFFMMTLFLILGKMFASMSVVKDISYLFYGTVFGLGFIYLLFPFKIKGSLHLLSMGVAIGYFLLFQQIQAVYVLPIIVTFIFLSGILASSRLRLKAHNVREVYLGFFIGLFSPFIAYYIL
ncbi:hypothetical protein MK851_09715 [Tenacibaculum sp. 1B UA]|uniref:hypothetical protein n=1 Tax=unclassified Tenacibaculum TaxID=2635139 RepID=UPI0026E26E89|nr:MULTISPECIES: hypothetical protein [unclassified Tenacibaculum]MDO6675377.1 hypothetical protein [Tenacibaculum sp. 1_MG-2023]MDX8553895.1 hypothetical protein [Tenacibaculum sp. 1B UA]